jgi:uncharacterized protein (DUF2345 family)
MERHHVDEIATMDTTTELELPGQQRLLVEQRPDESLLRIVSLDGSVRLTITVTEKGPVLRFDGPDLLIQTTGALALDAERIALHARGALELTAGGDARIAARGDLSAEGRIVDVTAQLGNVNVKANDDVKLNGERVMMNC